MMKDPRLVNFIAQGLRIIYKVILEQTFKMTVLIMIQVIIKNYIIYIKVKIKEIIVKLKISIHHLELKIEGLDQRLLKQLIIFAMYL